MSNLIVTLLGIVLTAIAAIMALFFMGPSWQSASQSAVVDAWINQNNQILAAASQFQIQYQNDIVPMCGLLNAGYLSTYPNLINLGPSPQYPPATTSGWEGNVCGWQDTGDTYNGSISRYVLGYNSQLVVATTFAAGSCSSGNNLFSAAALANSLPIQWAIAFNNSTHAQIATGLTYSNGVPQIAGTWTKPTTDQANGSGACTGSPPTPTFAQGSGGAFVLLNASGAIQTGCYMGTAANAKFIWCYQKF